MQVAPGMLLNHHPHSRIGSKSSQVGGRLYPSQRERFLTRAGMIFGKGNTTVTTMGGRGLEVRILTNESISSMERLYMPGSVSKG